MFIRSGVTTGLRPRPRFIAGIAVAVFLAGYTLDIIQLMRASGATSARVVETFEDEREDDRGRIGSVTVAVYEFFVRDTRFEHKGDFRESWPSAIY